MSVRIEHFVYGAHTRLERFCADLPAGTEVLPVPGGLVLRDAPGQDEDQERVIGRIDALARLHGLDYDGHGQALPDAPVCGTGKPRDIQALNFTKRTGIAAGHGFAFGIPDGRFGHAVYLGSDRQGYLLLDISALVTDAPASHDAVRAAPRRYRQPILVWHTPFAATALSAPNRLAALPCDVIFRSSLGWPSPEQVALLERRFGMTGTDSQEGWNALLRAMARTGERLPGVRGYSRWTAQVSRTGVLKQVEDHAVLPFLPGVEWPMPWQPTDMDEIGAILGGAPDMIAVRDKIT